MTCSCHIRQSEFSLGEFSMRLMAFHLWKQNITWSRNSKQRNRINEIHDVGAATITEIKNQKRDVGNCLKHVDPSMLGTSAKIYQIKYTDVVNFIRIETANESDNEMALSPEEECNSVRFLTSKRWCGSESKMTRDDHWQCLNKLNIIRRNNCSVMREFCYPNNLVCLLARTRLL